MMESFPGAYVDLFGHSRHLRPVGRGSESFNLENSPAIRVISPRSANPLPAHTDYVRMNMLNRSTLAGGFLGLLPAHI